MGGIAAQSDEIAAYANQALAQIEAWLEDAGVDASGAASTSATLGSRSRICSRRSSAASPRGSPGSSVAFGVAFTIFSVFFLLKDGPAFRRWIDGHLGVPRPVAETITGDVITSLRKYFTGLTIVAVFNAVVVGVGALLLVPLGEAIVVTFVTAYVPYVGAFVAGAFAVMLALADGGTTTALLMLLIVLLANGLLQNVVQPIAFGATLDLNPLLVLVATIAAEASLG